MAKPGSGGAAESWFTRACNTSADAYPVLAPSTRPIVKITTEPMALVEYLQTTIAEVANGKPICSCRTHEHRRQ